MNASAPGWQPDPTGRHEYRYWDGGRWTDDVADGGLTAVDPLSPTDATTVMDPTLSGAPTTAYQPVPGPGAGPGGDTFSGAHPPARPPRSGPSTGLLVGLGVLALALVVAIAVVLLGGDDGDDDTATDDIGTSQTTESDSPGTTTPADDGDEADIPLDLGTGDLNFDDPEVRDMIVDIVAEQFESSGLTREQAECFTSALLDGMGAERLAEIGESGDMSSITPEDMSSMMDAYTDCGLTDVPLG